MISLPQHCHRFHQALLCAQREGKTKKFFVFRISFHYFPHLLSSLPFPFFPSYSLSLPPLSADEEVSNSERDIPNLRRITNHKKFFYVMLKEGNPNVMCNTIMMYIIIWRQTTIIRSAAPYILGRRRQYIPTPAQVSAPIQYRNSQPATSLHFTSNRFSHTHTSHCLFYLS